VTDRKTKRPADASVKPKPSPKLDSGKYVPWRTARPRAGEAVRWECVDGRWVTISLSESERAGKARVRNSDGRTEYLDSFEVALELAKRWRTV